MTTHPTPPDELSEFAELMRDEQEYSGARAGVDPAIRRARRRRGLVITAIVLAIVIGATGGYAAWALNAPLPDPVAESLTPRVAVPVAASIALPQDGASAVSVSGADDYLGAAASGTWLTGGSDEPRSIASISKLVTALVVLDAKPLAGIDDPGPTITFGKAAHDLYDKYYVLGATIAPMPTGTSMSLHDALATMLLPSASNYAEAISTWAFGSQSAFVHATRDWLAAHGLTGTTIVEPTGIDARNVSTPSDLLAIARLAASDPVIAGIAATSSITVNGPGTVRNTNSLLGTDGITGLKTGNLGEGTYNLLYTASVDVGLPTPLSVTGVRLGGYSHDSVDRDVLRVLDDLRGGFHHVLAVKAGQEVGTYSTPWGSTARIVAGRDASILTWSDTPIAVTMKAADPGTYRDGEEAGSITVTAGPNTVTVPLEVRGSITPPTARWRLTHPAELGR